MCKHTKIVFHIGIMLYFNLPPQGFDRELTSQADVVVIAHHRVNTRAIFI